MNPLRYMPLVAALSLTAVGSPPRSDEQEPLTTPTRDVDITYQITRPGQPAIIERRRQAGGVQFGVVDPGPVNAILPSDFVYSPPLFNVIPFCVASETVKH